MGRAETQQKVEHNSSQGNPFFGQYVALLVRLHDAMRHGDEDEAERLREKMDGPGLHLNAAAIQRVKRLSSDLYRLDGDETFPPQDRSPRPKHDPPTSETEPHQ